MDKEIKEIIIGSDHAAIRLKKIIIEHLEKKGVKVEDVGPDREDSVDYPDFGVKVASLVSRGKFNRGILLCGTGLGMSMVANRFAGVRAALCSESFGAAMSRQHNDSNLLVLGGRVTGDVLALEIVDKWFETPFDGGRHQLRIDKFDNIGEKIV